MITYDGTPTRMVSMAFGRVATAPHLDLGAAPEAFAGLRVVQDRVLGVHARDLTP
ncbi:hypothetical protein M8542_07910 [Amycolatopsis sp. OK19-0408]|uniref:Uncharacterized protein n=1 Tax=Amycolatopsis iheyensis TaxID=2945988 RepID=A0A9X2SHU0_9PSEU|nr:hypothetical protein [Amycolatopsis iheyensis]MCR6482739.1 hypothetical protein [Amycolatopsis iheyensis]